MDLSILKQIIDALIQKMESGFIFMANVNGDNVNYFARSTNNMKDKVNCGQIVKDVSMKSNGNGGGSPIFAQGGGKNVDVDAIINEVKDIIAHV